MFCAIYGHEPIVEPNGEKGSAEACISYRQTSRARTVYLTKRYAARAPQVPAPASTPYAADGQETVLFYSTEGGGSPDWLAEIFEWISCADEYSVSERDAVGRVPFSASYVGRHHLDIRQPFAAVAMRLLQREICCVVPRCSERPAPEVGDAQHFVVNTHDVDYVPLSQAGEVKRLGKNAIISLLVRRSPRLALHQARLAAYSAIAEPDGMEQLCLLLSRELQAGANASYYFIASKRHRRDANYGIQDPRVTQWIQSVLANDMEVGVHGSYTSLDQAGRLASEFAQLRQLGVVPCGGRQHWLRFTLDQLIPEVETAGAEYDASLGWPEQPGFRAGACFAFPPYDFRRERAAKFLEIPLMIMDQALQQAEQTEESRWRLCTSLLASSRQYGWGGIAVLWHPAAFGGTQLQQDIGRIYWRLLDSRDEWGDTWTSGASFLCKVRERYVSAGLPCREITEQSI